MESRMRSTVAVVVVAVCTLVAAQAALAAPYTFTFKYTRVFGQGQASGSAVFDDSLLAPNTNLDFTCDLSQLTSFNLTVSGLPTSPSTTSFTKADLNAWQLATDSSGQLTDLNFFMREGKCGANKVNADNYAINGVEVFLLSIYQGSSTNALATFDTSGRIIPALSGWGLVLLAALLAAAGAVALRRLS